MFTSPGFHRCVRLCAGLVPLIVGESAAEPPSSEAPFSEAKLEEARNLLIMGRYDETIELLGPLLREVRDDETLLSETYLMLIKTYVTAGNFFRSRPQGSVTSDLYYERAEELTLECLLVEELRYTAPDPPREFPPEMLAMFERVRSKNFGGFRVIGLEPPGAEVTLDGRTIKPAGDLPLPEIQGLTAEPHEIRVRAEGYQEDVDTIRIAAGSTLERDYTLEKGKGVRWWTTRVGGAALLVGLGIAASAAGGDEGSPAAATPLPIPPDPPE